MTFNKEKFKALAHYVCARAEDPSKLGATKLNKILWYSDVISFLKWGKPITGEIYEKRQFGPMPRHIYSVLEELKFENKLAITEVEHFGRKKREYIPLVPSLTEMFSADEISLVDEMARAICDNHTATSISDSTHDDIWGMALIGEQIPYEAALVSCVGELDGQDMEWAKKEASRIAA